MILSASRRTDIPAFYDEWLKKRIEQGEVLVRNPRNPRQVSRLILSPETVDGFVFWSKNPAPMLSWLPLLRDYTYYFQFTLNPYESPAEPNLPGLWARVETMKRLADRIGRQRIVWRYDPILLGGPYTVEWHLAQFEKLTGQLADSAGSVTISFLDQYERMRKRVQPLGLVEIAAEQMRRIGAGFAAIAGQRGLSVSTCAERIDLSAYGIGHASCVSPALLEELGGLTLRTSRDPNQRQACGCAASVDIGAYHTCPHGCLYCYANDGPEAVAKNAARYDPDSPLLCGHLRPEDVVKDRKMESLRDGQLRLPFGL